MIPKYSSLKSPVTKQELESFDWSADIEWAEDEPSVFKTTGIDSFLCTGWAAEIQRILGKDRVKVLGFYEEDNPTSKIGQVSDGHDFAVVDGKYIVDPWIREVENLSQQIVFDLKTDQKIIKQLYGNPKTWKEVNI